MLFDPKKLKNSKNNLLKVPTRRNFILEKYHVFKHWSNPLGGGGVVCRESKNTHYDKTRAFLFSLRIQKLE